MSKQPLRPDLLWAIEAAQDKQAAEVTVLDLAGLGAFTDAFLLCTGLSTPQVQAICDAIEEKLETHGRRPDHREGRAGAEWLFCWTTVPSSCISSPSGCGSFTI